MTLKQLTALAIKYHEATLSTSLSDSRREISRGALGGVGRAPSTSHTPERGERETSSTSRREISDYATPASRPPLGSTPQLQNSTPQLYNSGGQLYNSSPISWTTPQQHVPSRPPHVSGERGREWEREGGRERERAQAGVSQNTSLLSPPTPPPGAFRIPARNSPPPGAVSYERGTPMSEVLLYPRLPPPPHAFATRRPRAQV